MAPTIDAVISSPTKEVISMVETIKYQKEMIEIIYPVSLLEYSLKVVPLKSTVIRLKLTN